MTKVKSYCPICDNYGGTHAPCLGCGKYNKTGLVLGGISPGTPGAPVKVTEPLDDRINVQTRVFRMMPDKAGWGPTRRAISSAVCENSQYMLPCKRVFAKIMYNRGIGKTPVDIYACQYCGSQFSVEGLKQFLDEEDAS